MRARLAGLIATVAILLVFGPAHVTGVVLADPVCPSGTNWNNALHACI